MIPHTKYEGTEDFGFDVIWCYVIFDNITSVRPGRLSFDVKLSSLRDNAIEITEKQLQTTVHVLKSESKYSILYYGTLAEMFQLQYDVRLKRIYGIWCTGAKQLLVHYSRPDLRD